MRLYALVVGISAVVVALIAWSSAMTKIQNDPEAIWVVQVRVCKNGDDYCGARRRRSFHYTLPGTYYGSDGRRARMRVAHETDTYRAQCVWVRDEKIINKHPLWGKSERY